MDAMNGNNPSSRSFTSQIYHDTYDFIKLIRGNFSDRRVLITGASKGIGSETVVSFARAGYAHIALLARSSTTTTMEKAKDAAQAAGHPSPRFLELRADLVSMNSIASAAAKVQEAWGRLDILINNAGYLEAWKPIAESDPEDWWRSWEVNLKGSYLIDRAFIPLLLNGTEKTLVTVTSAGAWANHSGASAYQGSKMAQIKLNGHLMSEYGDQVIEAIHSGIGRHVSLTVMVGFDCVFHPSRWRGN